MAFRRFRKRCKSMFLVGRQASSAGIVNMGDVEPLCEGLSQENLENVSVFRGDVNMYRAEKGEDAIDLGVAMKYLKAARYNSCKALDIYKNYNKHRETYKLDSLRAHREPLCSEIGSKKLEIVGTYDEEGSPFVVFTGSRHDQKHSDTKATMQLLFYTLDQMSESEHTQDVGAVFFMDMRDVSTNALSFYNNLLSVLKDGYPLYMKSIYLVSPQGIKKMAGFTRTLKQEGDRVKIVNHSDLLQRFPESQLPLSLGGSYIPGKEGIYPRHFIKKAMPVSARNQIQRMEGAGPPIKIHREPSPKVSPKHSPPIPPHTSNGIKSDASSSHRTVNSLTKVFESKPSSTGEEPISGNPHSSADRLQNKLVSTPHTKPLPLPPPGNIKPSSLKSRAPQGKQNSQQPETSMSHSSKPLPPNKSTGPPTPPTKPGAVKQGSGATDKTAESTEKTFQKAQPFSFHKEDADKTKTKSEFSFKGKNRLKPQTSNSSVNEKSSPSASWATGKSSISGRIRNFEQQPTASGASGSVSDKKAPFVKADSADHISAGWSPRQNSDGERVRADSDCSKPSAGKIKKPLVPVKLLSGEDNEQGDGQHLKQQHFRLKQQPLMPVSQPPTTSRGRGKNPVEKKTSYENHDLGSRVEKRPNSSEYENVQIGVLKIPQNPSKENCDSIAVHTVGGGLPGLTGGGASNGSPHRTRSNSQGEYQNVTVHPGNSRLFSPTSQQRSLGNVAASNGGGGEYEVVEFRTKPQETKPQERVDESSDDETLFGQDGPPGLQEVIYENFGPDAGNKLMTVDELDRHVSSKGKDGLSAEYLKIKNEPLCGPYTSCRLQCNLPKNRYRDVVCYEESRVKLKVIKNKEGSDYIHANYVSGYNRPQAFILTQGPKEKTVPDFWRMVWEKQIHVIVMITKCVEVCKRKCAQYWPESDACIKHGNVTVEVSQTQSLDDYEQRTLKVTSKGVERTVTHFQFMAWPDYGVPKTGSSVLDLLFVVRDTQAKIISLKKDSKEFKQLPSYGPPVLVHCSAGVGRSGAFCALDNAIDELKDKRKVNLQGIVRKMRIQRAYTIQTDEQYEFCYKTLLEHAKSHR